ncbi:MAG: T9SS type A sorting domain-containing protein [Bacteroidia bacterium]
MITFNSKSNKLNLVAALVLIFSVFAASPVFAKKVIINTNTIWSAITTGSGIGGVPTKDDSVMVYGTNGSTTPVLTVNMAGEVEYLQLGQANTPRTGQITLNNGIVLKVYTHLDAQIPNNSKMNYVSFSNAASDLIVAGILGNHYQVLPSTRTVTINAALPVELISFTATKQSNEMVMLNFATAWEINNAGFEVERSTNGISWNNIGFVAGNGNATEINNYAFPTSLANISAPVVYYRLKQVDFNGQFEYSATRTLRLSATAAAATSVYPNPATSKISVSLEGIAAGEMAKISVMDMSGKILISANQVVEEGNFTMDMNIDNLTKGNYIVNIASPSANYNTKLVKF